LALVQQLTCAMKGRVDVVDSAPGAAFRLSFRRA
jgi:signal transduction histidine kinase